MTHNPNQNRQRTMSTEEAATLAEIGTPGTPSRNRVIESIVDAECYGGFDRVLPRVVITPDSEFEFDFTDSSIGDAMVVIYPEDGKR